jgi:hypothetical protein
MIRLTVPQMFCNLIRIREHSSQLYVSGTEVANIRGHNGFQQDLNFLCWEKKDYEMHMVKGLISACQSQTSPLWKNIMDKNIHASSWIHDR